VAVTVLGQLAAAGVAPGAAGLATVPAVIAHLVQIILDSMLVSRWQSQDAAAAQKAAWS
jgi:predicted Na+-dependent transporter